MHLLLHYKNMQKWKHLSSVTGTYLCLSASSSLPLSKPSFHLTTKTTAPKAPLHRALLKSLMFKPFSSFSPSEKPSFTAHFSKGKNQQHHLNLLKFLSDPAASQLQATKIPSCRSQSTNKGLRSLFSQHVNDSAQKQRFKKLHHLLLANNTSKFHAGYTFTTGYCLGDNRIDQNVQEQTMTGTTQALLCSHRAKGICKKSKQLLQKTEVQKCPLRLKIWCSCSGCKMRK